MKGLKKLPANLEADAGVNATAETGADDAGRQAECGEEL